MNQVYDFKRMMLFARLKFGLNKKALMLSVLGYFALLFIIGFFIAYANRNLTNEVPFFTLFHIIGLSIMMLLGSILLSSRSFQDMNTSERSLTQILIPASTFEKFIVPLISTSVIWMLFSFISYHIFSIIFNSLWVAFYGYDFDIFNGFQLFNIPILSEVIFGWLLLHSIFFLGATAFKKYPIVKTVLAHFIINQAYGILALLVILILFGSMESFGGFMNLIDNADFSIDQFDPELLLKRARIIFKVLLISLACGLYLTGYYKLKEREV